MKVLVSAASGHGAAMAISHEIARQVCACRPVHSHASPLPSGRRVPRRGRVPLLDTRTRRGVERGAKPGGRHHEGM